jgi:hypothetical protein
MPTGFPPAEQGVWLRWMVANALGFSIGGAGAGALIVAGERQIGMGVTAAPMMTPVLTWVMALAVIDAVAMGGTGVVIGIAQWIVLRQKLSGVGWWVLATSGGGALVGFVTGAFGGVFFSGADVGLWGFAAELLVGLPAIGLPPGVLQALVLRGKVEGAGRWAWAHLVSFWVGNGLPFPLMVALARVLGWTLPSAQAWGVAGVLAGALYGAITGTVLVRLLRRPVAAPTRGQTAAA